MKRSESFFFTVLIGLLSQVFCIAGENTRPGGLTVNFLAHTGQVFLNGYQVNTPLPEAIGRRENFQFAEIAQRRPFFGWIVNSGRNNTLQTAFRILLSSSPENLRNDSGDMWDSGKTESNQSVNVRYSGKPLEGGSVYFWKVKIWDNHGTESPYSEVGMFKTASQLVDYSTACYPLQKLDCHPVFTKKLSPSHTFFDFGKAAFGRLRINLRGSNDSDTVVVHLGENQKNGMTDRNPGGSIRYSTYKIGLKRGWNTYVVAIDPDRRNTGPDAVLMPEYTGDVTPFRYCEIENYPVQIESRDIVRETVFYPFDEEDSFFNCSDTVLNRIWELCKYSVMATSFTGVYIDGDRERIPYEADAYINQLCHYGVAREFSMARHSHEYLITKPTWPTEWILQSVLMAWNDYLYTGNTESLGHYYTDLKAKTLLALADEDGFISTTTGKVTPDVLRSIHFKGRLRDIVDWPHTGILGLGKNDGGETDGFVFQDVNTVVNAFHYQSLVLMGSISRSLNKPDDERMFMLQAEKLKKAFNSKLIDRQRGIYVDGIGTGHASLHGNMFPLAFGMVPEKNIKKVTEFIRSRGMACSVYGSQFLLDAIYNGHDAAYGLSLLASTAERSWYNMIRVGSTISLEAWDNKYKPNQDWNHAWGAAPANLIPRKLMGIEPLEPGFGKIRIKPQPASLEWAEIKHPTIRGDVSVSFRNDPRKSFILDIGIPGNTTAVVYLPFFSKKQMVTMNGLPVPYHQEGAFTVVDNIGSGKTRLSVIFEEGD